MTQAELRERVRGHLRKFIAPEYMIDQKVEGIMVDVKLYALGNRRSKSQNAYYWAYLEAIEAETGNLASDLHEWARRKFLPARFLSVQGDEAWIPASTTALTKAEFSDYLDKIAAETGIGIPPLL